MEVVSHVSFSGCKWWVCCSDKQICSHIQLPWPLIDGMWHTSYMLQMTKWLSNFRKWNIDSNNVTDATTMTRLTNHDKILEGTMLHISVVCWTDTSYEYHSINSLFHLGYYITLYTYVPSYSLTLISSICTFILSDVNISQLYLHSLWR